MTIVATLGPFTNVAIVLAVLVATLETTATPAEAAKRVVRDHRATPAWRPGGKKTNSKPVIRDNRTPSTWQPKPSKPRWPHYPHKH